MRFARYEFRPGLWPSVVTVIVLPLLLSLGYWQLDRAEQKAAMQADFTARYNLPALSLNALPARDKADELRWREVTLSGEYAANSYLLDNQVYAGETGYRLYTPLRLAGTGDAVLVERDWLPLGADRSHVPVVETPATRVELSGRVVPPPATGIMLGQHRIDKMASDRFRVQRIKPAELAQHSGIRLLPYVVRLPEAAHAEQDRKAALGGFGRERHLGYAFQWFALAVTLLVIYFWVNIKRRQTDNE